jgi:hypothetical protein
MKNTLESGIDPYSGNLMKILKQVMIHHHLQKLQSEEQAPFITTLYMMAG